MSTTIIALYILAGIGTSFWGALSEGTRREKIIRAASWLFVWPIIWLLLFVGGVVGAIPGKCAWCDKTVAPQGKRNLQKWRTHYLTECENHPLKEKLNKSNAALACVFRPTTPSDYYLAESYFIDEVINHE